MNCISWSGGKDSTASIILAYENNINIDCVVMSEVMFDNSRNISGENPLHIDWVYNVAIPFIENNFGYKVVVLRSNRDYIQLFNHIVTRSPNPEYNGKRSGFLIGGLCRGNSVLKMEPLRAFDRLNNFPLHYVGIAYDEVERLKRLKPNCRSLLAEFKVDEKSAYNLCREYGLLSPIYETSFRGGCWFCPNSSIRQYAFIKKNYPYLWEELRILSQETNLVCKSFKYGKSFDYIDKQVDLFNLQISMF